MQWVEVFQIVGAGIFSVASAGVLLTALASWLGKVWADRILAKEAHEFQRQMAEAQNKLDIAVEAAKRELDLVKEARVRVHGDKINIYRGIVDLVAKLLANLDALESERLPTDEAERQYDSFNEQRIRLYGYMAMFAPQAVMDAQDALMDHLLRVVNKQAPYHWPEVRGLALKLINEARRDVGIDKSDIKYNGAL